MLSVFSVLFCVRLNSPPSLLERSHPLVSDQNTTSLQPDAMNTYVREVCSIPLLSRIRPQQSSRRAEAGAHASITVAIHFRARRWLLVVGSVGREAYVATSTEENCRMPCVARVTAASTWRELGFTSAGLGGWSLVLQLCSLAGQQPTHLLQTAGGVVGFFCSATTRLLTQPVQRDKYNQYQYCSHYRGHRL